MLKSSKVGLVNHFHMSNVEKSFYPALILLTLEGTNHLLELLENKQLTIDVVQERITPGIRCTLDLIEVVYSYWEVGRFLDSVADKDENLSKKMLTNLISIIKDDMKKTNMKL